MEDSRDALYFSVFCSVPGDGEVKRGIELLFSDVGSVGNGQIVGHGGEDDDGAQEKESEERETNMYAPPPE